MVRCGWSSLRRGPLHAPWPLEVGERKSRQVAARQCGSLRRILQHFIQGWNRLPRAWVCQIHVECHNWATRCTQQPQAPDQTYGPCSLLSQKCSRELRPRLPCSLLQRTLLVHCRATWLEAGRKDHGRSFHLHALDPLESSMGSQNELLEQAWQKCAFCNL